VEWCGGRSVAKEYQAKIIQLLDVAFEGKMGNFYERHGRLFDVIQKGLE
jgi:hypothetical protein